MVTGLKMAGNGGGLIILIDFRKFLAELMWIISSLLEAKGLRFGV